MNQRLKPRKKEQSRPEPQPRTLQKEQRILEGQSTDVATRVRELENFIVGAPRLQQERLLQNINVVPPPDFDLTSGGEHFLETRRLSYGRQQRIQQIRHRNLALFLILLSLSIGVAIWLL